MAMTARERVLCTLDHREPDRVPLILGTSNATGIKMKPCRALKREFGIESPDRYIYDWPELGTALPDEATLAAIGSDARGVLDRFPRSIYEKNGKRAPHEPFLDDWGGGQSEIEPGVWYPGIHPMPEASTVADIEAFPWPDPDDPSRYEGVRAEARRLAAENLYAIIGTPWLLFPFERAHELQGLDVFLTNMVAEPDFAKALLWKIEGICKRIMGHFLDEAGESLDMIKIGDDLGTQESLMISPGMYREFLKPVHADLIAFIKSRTKAKVFFHTDGDVFDLIPDLIEIGVDVLNPIQTSAGRMSDLAALKKSYGKNLVFCGGIDTQRVLPNGSPEEVRREVARVMGLLGPGGGYMVSAVHTIMDGVPAANVIAMAKAVRELGQYPLNRG
jgi:uroporphyrinogen decarboxylase